MRDKFVRMDYETKFREKGFKHIYTWTDAPKVVYPAHHHNDRVAMYITSGGLTFTFDDGKVTLREGDFFKVPPRKTHSAIVREKGCTYVVGEMIEGDS